MQRRLAALAVVGPTALFATLNANVIEDVSPRHVLVHTRAVDREDYLAHPPCGEHLRDEDARIVARLDRSIRPQVQIVISDGLNANALNEHLRTLLPPFRRQLAQAGCRVGETFALSPLRHVAFRLA
jgi:ethanolamine ammonia-lyase small subunit